MAKVASKSHIFTKFVGELEVKPQEQPHLVLGVYSSKRPAKGFSIEYTPEPESTDSLVSQIYQVGDDEHYKLILQIANYGTDTVRAEVWRMN